MIEPRFPRTERIDGSNLAVVAIGGAVGAAARWAAGVRFAVPSDELPWTTLVVNLVGCLLIGVAASRIERDSRAWSFVVTGLLGGFTTMSAFAVELNDLVDEDETLAAGLYFAVTLAGGAIAVMLGGRRRS